MKGFTFPIGHKDIFVETELKNKTDVLAGRILRKLINHGFDIPNNPDTRREVIYYLQKAECEIHTLSNGRKYYEIHGENFGGKGSFVDDGNTIIIKL